MKPQKRRTGGQPANFNARIYNAPMDKNFVVRLTEGQYNAFADQCAALDEKPVTKAREMILKFAGWTE